jgi:TolC family type I secretion outer membrane protein
MMVTASAAVPQNAGAAETVSIAQALAFAYSGNPALGAERARQRATDEAVPQALSGWRPTIIANADAGLAWTNGSRGRGTDSQPLGASVTVSQPIFRGFRTVSDTARAEAVVNAGRQNLLAVEQQVLLDAASAYMNVIKDRNILSLRQHNVGALQEQLRASEERLKLGEDTRTDVSQARARLALSQAALARAEADLESSKAFYARVIGRPPGALRFPPLSKRAPASLEAALAIAAGANPIILAAGFNEEAARHNIDLVRGELLPEISINAQYAHNQQPYDAITSNEQGAIFAQVTIPIYEGGAVYSRIREAKQTASQRALEILELRRQVRQQVTETWNVLLAAKSTIRAAKTQVEANRLALEGVQQEMRAGSRTVLDVLDAEQELVDSQVLLATAERDRIIAGYQLIASVGHMTAHDLNLDVLPYDPEQNYRATRRKFIGTDIENAP